MTVIYWDGGDDSKYGCGSGATATGGGGGSGRYSSGNVPAWGRQPWMKVTHIDLSAPP